MYLGESCILVDACNGRVNQLLLPIRQGNKAVAQRHNTQVDVSTHACKEVYSLDNLGVQLNFSTDSLHLKECDEIVRAVLVAEVACALVSLSTDKILTSLLHNGFVHNSLSSLLVSVQEGVEVDACLDFLDILRGNTLDGLTNSCISIRSDCFTCRSTLACAECPRKRILFRKGSTIVEVEQNLRRHRLKGFVLNPLAILIFHKSTSEPLVSLVFLYLIVVLLELFLQLSNINKLSFQLVNLLGSLLSFLGILILHQHLKLLDLQLSVGVLCNGIKRRACLCLCLCLKVGDNFTFLNTAVLIEEVSLQLSSRVRSVGSLYDSSLDITNEGLNLSLAHIGVLLLESVDLVENTTDAHPTREDIAHRARSRLACLTDFKVDGFNLATSKTSAKSHHRLTHRIDNRLSLLANSREVDG